MTDRMARLNLRMAEAGLDCALIHKGENIRYLSGYTGEGALLVREGSAVILTDFRYVEQAQKQAPGCEVRRTTGEVTECDLLKALLPGKVKLAVERDRVTMAQADELRAALPQAELCDLMGLPEALRATKDEDEIGRIRRACEIACAAFDKILGEIHEGMTEKELKRELDYAIVTLGAEGTSFSTIACAGPNGSLPHAIATDRPIGRGELVTMDFGAIYEGYCSDMTRTVAVGEISRELEDMYCAVLEAQQAALAVVKAGMRCKDVDKVARDMLDQRYPGAFGHGLGHGVGLLIHEKPNFNARDDTILLPGHVMTVEPGVYLPGVGGCRIEDMGVVTQDGFIDMIRAPKSLIKV